VAPVGGPHRRQRRQAEKGAILDYVVIDADGSDHRYGAHRFDRFGHPSKLSAKSLTIVNVEASRVNLFARRERWQTIALDPRWPSAGPESFSCWSRWRSASSFSV